MAAQEARGAKCPPPDTIPGCPCYNFENGGLFLECAGATEESLRNALSGVIHAAGEEGNRPRYNAQKAGITGEHVFPFRIYK